MSIKTQIKQQPTKEEKQDKIDKLHNGIKACLNHINHKGARLMLMEFMREYLELHEYVIWERTK